MNLRRGMTLVELLLALSLLTSLTIVGVEWAVTSARLSAEVGSTVRWNAAARATLDRIGEDLISGDFPTAKADQRPRVWVESDQLIIETRDGSTVRVTYRVDHDSGLLLRSASNSRDSARLCLGKVAVLSCELVPEIGVTDTSSGSQLTTLIVSLERSSEDRLQRRYVVPTEWLP